VLALDLAGFGLTPPTGRGTGIEANRRLVDGFLRALDLPPTVLVGNSMGGMLCVIQCAHAPRSVDRMVLVDAALPRPPRARPEVRVAAFFALFAVPPVGRWISSTRPRRLGAERLVRRTLEVVAADPDRVDPAMVELLVEAARERMGLDHASRAFAEAAREVFLSQAFPSRYRAVARAARCPALVLHGTADRLVPLGSARAAVAEHPNWDLQVLEGLGHVPQMEAPELFLATVEGWLDRRHAARAAPA
jgi:pimeloyl-ACP methyl ester carboxylesterase